MSRHLKYGFRKKDFLYGAIITAIAAAIAGLGFLIGLGTKVFNPVGQAAGNYRISDGFFFSRYSPKRDVSTVNPGIVIVDIGDCSSREEIAGVVDRINAASPRLLAVDIIFGASPSLSSAGDSLLREAFSGIGRLLLASRHTAKGTERSFFADEVECAEGDVNFEYGIVRSFGPEYDYGSGSVPTLIGLIAKEGGICGDFRPQLINYSPVHTVTIPSGQLPDNDFLKDQIVLLGDGGDLRDFHDIPIVVDGQARAAGIGIIARCLYTLRPGNGFRNCPGWLELIIGILLTWLFCTFIASPLYRTEHFNGLWISIWQIVALAILLAVTYMIFWGLHFSISLTWWLIGIGFSGMSTELFYFIKSKLSRP